MAGGWAPLFWLGPVMECVAKLMRIFWKGEGMGECCLNLYA